MRITGNLIYMKTKKLIQIITVVIGGMIAATYSVKNEVNLFKKEEAVKDIPVNSATPLEFLPEIYKKMEPWAWPKNHPVSISELAYVKVLYWGFDDKPHIGVLIVNKELANEVLEIFSKLYEAKFPIEQM